jgi:hypothetical protein
MFYFSEGTEFLFSDKFEGDQVMQRLFFERYSHELLLLLLVFAI